MWGLLLLFFAVVYFALVGLLLVKIKPYWGKALVLIAAILIPNADDWYYRQQLADYCKTEAGLKVYEQTSRKDGLIVRKASVDEKALQRFQTGYLEWQETIGSTGISYWRMDRLPDGSKGRSYKISDFMASYQLTRVETDSGNFAEVVERVMDRKRNVVMGEFKELFYYGGWYPKALVGRGGLVAACGKGGQVISRKEWGNRDTTQYSINEVVSKVFSKN